MPWKINCVHAIGNFVDSWLNMLFTMCFLQWWSHFNIANTHTHTRKGRMLCDASANNWHHIRQRLINNFGGLRYPHKKMKNPVTLFSIFVVLHNAVVCCDSTRPDSDLQHTPRKSRFIINSLSSRTCRSTVYKRQCERDVPLSCWGSQSLLPDRRMSRHDIL